MGILIDITHYPKRGYYIRFDGAATCHISKTLQYEILDTGLLGKVLKNRMREYFTCGALRFRLIQ